MSESESHDTYTEAPEVIGFWGTTWKHRATLLAWDLYCAAAITAAGVLLIHKSTLTTALPGLLTAEFGIIGALLGIVIAGLAIIVGFLSSDYAVVLMRSDGGPAGDFWPFWYVAALAALSIVASGGALLLVQQSGDTAYPAFAVTTFLASYALLASVNLVAFVKAQGETRVFQMARRAAEDQANGDR
ncbi:MAG: hypothetical protein WB709_12005 [Solirubrobacteraceae bacterium]